MCPDKGESQKLAVKQYEFYNRGPALFRPQLIADWPMPTIPGFWLVEAWRGALSCCYYRVCQAQGRCEERGHVGSPEKLRTSWGRLVCRSGGATPSPLLDAAKKCFLVIGCSETCKSVSLTLHIIGQTTCFKFVLIQLTKELKWIFY